MTLEQQFVPLTEADLTHVEGGRVSWSGEISINLHQAINSTGRFFSGIYNAGRNFGRNFYNAFF